jgi:hypothetical protein
MIRSVYEKPQPTNPHRLTIDQHVFPATSIKRFVDGSGRVCVCDVARNKTRMAKPNDALFIAKRAWDQRAEVGYMKRIEDAFQELASKIIERKVSQVGDTARAVVNDFYALWYLRARYRQLPEQEIQMRGVMGGGGLTLDQEEIAERKGCVFMRADGRWPARHLNGIRIQTMINHRHFGSLATAQWGVIRAHEGEFLVPDIPNHTILPLTPALCLVSPAANGIILKDNVALINRSIKAASDAYFFARDLSKCPL